MCHVLKLNRSSFYQWVNTREKRRLKMCSDALIGAKIKTTFDDEHGLYGAKRIAARLNSDTDFGLINHKKVARIMKSMGLKGFTKRRRCVTTRRKLGHRVMPDLVGRKFTADRPNHVYVGDITYLPCKGGKTCTLPRSSTSTLANLSVMHSRITGGYRWLSKLCLMPERSAEALKGQFSILIMAVCIPHRHLGTTAPSLVCANPWEQWERVLITP